MRGVEELDLRRRLGLAGKEKMVKRGYRVDKKERTND